MPVWKQLVAEDDSNAESALETVKKEIDFVACSLWKTLKRISDEFKRLQSGDSSAAFKLQLEEQLEAMDLISTIVLSDGRTLELCESGTG
ncbi:hypothetical protein V7S43_009865 [Phytophthora oleae]|uniref:Uncharacterized protein n=1 Tax=Phytophthora oleae TaxID=2107226 RepID=A0ABD3FE76_9STRA